MTGPLDSLLEKLCSGDAAAAEQVFVDYEPYLRKVVRRLLPAQMRSRFDSSDIVQSVWSDALRGFREAGWRFTTTEQLRVFLVKMTRNRFIDRVRQHSASLDRERVIAQTGRHRHRDGVPGPGAAVEAAELWERILALCPPEHHALLRLKQHGLSNTEIAAMTGIHAGSVRRVLRELAVRVHTERGVAVSDNCR